MMPEHPPIPPESLSPPLPAGEQPVPTEASGEGASGGREAEQHIRYDDLSPEVRSYADNIRAQIEDLCTEHGIPMRHGLPAIKNEADSSKFPIQVLQQLRDLLKQLDVIRATGVLPPEVRESRPVTATVREDALCTIPAERGKEVTIDLREVLDSSLALLESKAPPTWDASLREQFPHGLSLTPDQRKTIEHAIEHGFTHALLMPGGDTQGITTIEIQRPNQNDPTKQITEPTLASPDTLLAAMDHLLKTCSNEDGVHPVPDLPDEEQYTAPNVHDPETTKVPTLRTGAPSRARPYLVLYRPGNIPESLKNLMFSQADAAFATLAVDLHLQKLTGLTTLEHLLLQRKEVEARAPLTPDQRTATYGDARPHAFDAYSETAAESNWTWDLDSRVPGGYCRGHWHPERRQSWLVWSDILKRYPELGARPVVVVEL